jgi:hypothetical protein
VHKLFISVFSFVCIFFWYIRRSDEVEGKAHADFIWRENRLKTLNSLVGRLFARQVSNSCALFACVCVSSSQPLKHIARGVE